MTEEEEEDTALLLLVVALLQLVMPDGACPELVERVPASPFGLELDYLIMHYEHRQHAAKPLNIVGSRR